MMYNNNFVVVIKSDGKVLRELDGCVRLPFGSQYSVLLKNLDSRKAVVRVSIDGEDMCDGGRIIVEANSFVELKGKIQDSGVRHKFKFIERTREVSSYRGNHVEDGLIRIEYWFEQRTFNPVCYYTSYSNVKLNHVYSGFFNTNTIGPNSDQGSTYNSIVSTTCINDGSNVIKYNSKIKDELKTDIGITVKGSHTKQDFVNGHIGALEDYSSVIVIQLKGKTKQGGVFKKPVTVKTRFICPTCGHKSRSYTKWCSHCGTNLEL